MSKIHYTAVGIDPGLHGAIGILTYSELNDTLPLTGQVMDIPVTNWKYKSRVQKEYDIKQIESVLRSISMANKSHVVVGLEKQSPFPGQGVVGMFRLGEMYGMLKAVLNIVGLSYTLVIPAAWKRRFQLIGREKAASIEQAVALCPGIRDDLAVRHDRADAVLIAAYAWERITGFKKEPIGEEQNGTKE